LLDELDDLPMLRKALVAVLLLLLALIQSLTFAQPDPPPTHRLGIAHISSVDVPRSAERYQHAIELGAVWNRWPLYWDRVETRRNQFDWAAYDALVVEDLSYGLQLDVILLGIAPQHRDGDTIANLDEPIFADDTDEAGDGKAINPQHPWAVFVSEAVQRYMPDGVLAREQGWDADVGVRVWEVWNEPDYTQFWSAGVRDYARLLQVAYLVIKHYDPDATVMVGGLLYPNQSNWLARVLSIYQDNEPNPEDNNWYMDAVAVHNYGDAWRSGWLTLVARQTLIEYDIERPIWVTETGVPIWDDYPGPTWTADTPESRTLLATAEQQAAFFIQSAAYAWAEGAQVIIYHQLYDDCGNQPPGTDFAPESSGVCRPGEICAGDVFGIYTNPASAVCFAQHPQPDSARPIAESYRLVADVFAEQPFSRRGIIDDARDDGVITITFTRPDTDERVVVIWNTDERAQTFALPALGEGAAVYSIDAQQSIAPTDGEYSLRLPAADMPRQRFEDERIPVDIGGMPVIIVEHVTDERVWARLLYDTFESTDAPPPTPTPLAQVNIDEDEIADLQAQSPTGVIFVPLQAARVRDLPTTEGSEVIASLNVNQVVNVIGRLEDSSWLQIDYSGEPAWVAVFLGQVVGDLGVVPVVDLEAEAETGD
jgi:hypothetical protein